MKTIIYIVLALVLISGGYVWYVRSGGEVPDSVSDVTNTISDAVTGEDTDGPAIATSSLAATQTYTVDTTKSSLSFASVGSVKFKNGSIVLKNGVVTSGTLIADMNTLSTEMLKGKDYFDVATYPTATFTITGSRQTAEGTTLVGTLAVKDMSKGVEMPVGQIEDASTANNVGMSFDGDTSFDTGKEGIFKTVSIHVDITAYVQKNAVLQ